ncbi:MAG: outer membrane lipoprotein carrier protein LolA [Pirellulaceae bacterium]
MTTDQELELRLRGLAETFNAQSSLERSNGVMVVLTDTKRGRLLALNTRKKVAGFQSAVRGLGDHLHSSSRRWPSPRGFLDYLAGIAASAVESLGEQQIAGRNLVGFELPRDQFAQDCGLRLCIWVDPRTQLPVRFEMVPDDPDDLAASFLQYIITFTFNKRLDDSLFQLTVPEGYRVLEDDAPSLWDTVWETTVPLPPHDKKLASPVVELGVGIGGARFGMTLKRVLDVLGPPDNAFAQIEYTAKEQKEVDATYKKATKEAAEKGLNKAEQRRYVNEATNRLDLNHRPADGVTLEYLSRGYVVIVTKEQGLLRIFCDGGSPNMRPFTGRTAKGIRMGATVEQIEKAYGPPDRKSEDPDGGAGLYYKSLHALFDVRKNGLWQLSLDKQLRE